MAPIRLGIIGLSSSAVTSWASSAHLPYLLSPRGRTKYTIAALCNSSVEAAKAAIQTYGLDGTQTRAYGSPEALAADPDVDLVLCCTRVDTHYALIKPSVEAGKAVYVEWPLTHDVESSRALADLVTKKGVRSVVGLQGQLTPIVQRMKEFVREGSLGKVLSSEVRASWGTLDRVAIKEGLSYFADRKVGGNVYMIGFAHSKCHPLSGEDFPVSHTHLLTIFLAVFDYVQVVLGEVTNLQPRFQLQRPEIKLLDNSGKQAGTVTSDVPDLMIANGILSDPTIAQNGATLNVRFRRGQPFKGEPGFTWHINCEKGEIRLISPTGSSLHANAYSVPVTLEVHDHATDEVRDIDWTWPAWQQENDLPLGSRSVARLYETFYADAVEGGPREYPDFADALKRHEQLHSLLAGWKPE